MFLATLSRTSTKHYQVRSYAQIAHLKPNVIPQYDLYATRSTLTNLQATKTARRRKPWPHGGKQNRIPAVLMRPKQDPIYLKLSTGQVMSLTNHSNKLRYTLVVDNETTYEVYPTHLGLHPISLVPESVSFALWNGNPKTLWTPEFRKKIRGWESAYLREQKLKRDMKEAKLAIKAIVSEGVPLEVVDEMPELFETYKTGLRKERAAQFFTLQQEADAMLKASREDLNAQVLSLEKEEREIDEIMQDADDEDEA